MQLKIKNVAKIKEAAINFNGITVIAGENNTGKSTIGKLLFTIFNSMNNADEKIDRERKNKLFRIFDLMMQNYSMNSEIKPVTYRTRTAYYRRMSEKIIEAIQENKNDNAYVQKYIQDYLDSLGIFENKRDLTLFVEEYFQKIIEVANIPDIKIMTEVITIWFNKVFMEQISPLNEDNQKSEIELIIKNKKMSCFFEENNCREWNSEYRIIHQAFYVDNPFIIDHMSESILNQNKYTDVHLLRHLCQDNDNIIENVFDAVIAKEKLKDIYDMIDNIIEGEIVENQDGEYYLKSQKYKKPLNVINLSTGLKSFAVIKKLLVNGSLNDKDVLILDEPEIHLHPEWQLKYAELIVLLQKQFDLTLVITTHSPYFLDAIDVFSAKHQISDRVNYYLADNDEDGSNLFDVTDNIDAIYKKLSNPMQILENIRSKIQ